MERKRKVLQVYALIVCILAIITFIICISVLVSSIMERSDPLLSGYSKYDLSSFESYKMDRLSAFKESQTYTTTDEKLKGAYEDAKKEKINKVLHSTMTAIVVSSILIAISIILFFTHWWMIKKFSKESDVPSNQT